MRIRNFSILNFELINQNSKLSTEQFKIAKGDNSKFKIQNSKSALPIIQNSKLKIQNSKRRLSVNSPNLLFLSLRAEVAILAR